MTVRTGSEPGGRRLRRSGLSRCKAGAGCGARGASASSRAHSSVGALGPVGALAAAAALLPLGAAAQSAGDLFDLSIEELGRIEVTSVSRREESVNASASSVYVITRDEIRRSGVTSLPEALRLAPGVEVARNSSHSWTISMRGFSSDLSNKLLVLIDGRSVYSPLFAGVFWDAQDTLIEDVDRIEVIGGPAGTEWGANAVNGVINIITRSAWETEGGFAQVGGGDEQESFTALRYGRRVGDGGAARVYAKRFARDATVTVAGADAVDEWDMAQAGFRLDFELGSSDSLTVQGDLYEGEEAALVRSDFTLGTLPAENLPGTVDIGGHNVLARWQRELDEGASFRLQAYLDYTERDIPGTYDESRDTADVDFQHRLSPLGRHDLLWGAALRVTSDDIVNTRFATFDPASRTDRTYSVFLQDRIDLLERRLLLTLGSKYEHNDYSGFEHQPSARLTWLATGRQTLWAALSRAVRIPARLNEDLELYAPIAVPGMTLPFYVNVRSRDDFLPEELFARELGYRVQLGRDLSFDVAWYEHDYDNLMTNEVVGPPAAVGGATPYLVLPIVQGNGLDGDTYGGTATARWQPLPRWRLDFQLSTIELDLALEPGSGDSSATRVAGNSPERQAAVYSFVELPHGIELYTGVRYVDERPNQNVPSYLTVDVNVGWELHERLRASLTVQNLNDEQHLEFGEGNAIERSAYVRLAWSF